MARDEAPPWGRGETFYNGTAKESVFADPLNYLGKEYVFEPNSNVGADQDDSSGRAVRVKVAMNVSGQALLPKRVARYKLIAPLECQVDGYAFAVTDHLAGVIDEFLPPAGVANNDLFYLVIDGPTVCTSITSSFVALALGDRIEAQLGTSVLDATAGLVSKITTSQTVATHAFVLGRADQALAAAGTFTCVVHFPKV